MEMARTRPQNFPHRRLALLAQMIHQGFYLVGKLDDARTIDDMRGLFNVELTGFWTNNYTFAGKGGRLHTARTQPRVNRHTDYQCGHSPTTCPRNFTRRPRWHEPVCRAA